MKKINLYICLVALFSLWACEEDYEAPFPATDITWYTSMPTLTEYALPQEKMMGFIDASQGALSHEWIIEEGSYFLQDGLKQGDSIANYVDYDQGLVSDKEGVNVYFTQSGRKSVRLKNTFDKKVTYNGTTPLEAVEVDGAWVIDTTFVVDVYAPVAPAYKVCRVIVNPDGSTSAGEVILEVGADDKFDSAESDTWKAVDVEVGSRLMFIDLTVDPHPELVQPDKRTWTIKNNTEAQTLTDSVAEVYFNVYGYKTTGLGNLLAERTTPVEVKAKSQKIIPLKVNVIQSSQPFTYADGAVWSGQNSIAFNVTGEVSKLGTGAESAFTVHVNNTTKGLDKDITVTAVAVDPANATRINLTLSEAIYGDDVITVSFDEAGTSIESVDERPFESFTAKTVIIPVGGDNLLADKKDWAGFENGSAGLNAGKVAGYWVGAQDALNPTWSRVTNMFNEGDASMQFSGDINAALNLYGMNFGNSVDIEAGAFEVSHKIYIEEGSTIKTLKTDIGRKSTGWGIDVTMYWDLENLPRGEWVTIKKIVNFPVAYNSADKTRYSYYVKGADNPGITGDQKFYLDDMGLVKVDAGIRP